MKLTLVEKRSSRTGEIRAVRPLTSKLAEEVARFNGCLSAAAVEEALVRGDRVYTSFNYYTPV